MVILLPLLTLLGGALLAFSVLLDITGPQALADLLPQPGELSVAAQASAGTPPAPEPTIDPTATLVMVPASPTTAPTPTATPEPIAADDVNILLLGSDRRPSYGSSWRTDTLIIVAVRPKARLVALFSLPRDLWVEIPGHGSGRINTVDYLGEREMGTGGGVRLLAETLKQNLHIPIHAFVRIDFAGLERVIDALGGIDVYSTTAYDELMDGMQPGLWRLRVAQGLNHMDGRTALGYARSRLSSNDLDRNRRQQQILLAIRDAALRPSTIPQLPHLVSSLADTVDTDLSLPQVLALLRLACQLDSSCYRTRTFDRSLARDWTAPGGAMVLLPNHERIQEAWAELTQ